jgi:D-sedoheptulose 7-phosphate isomerase
MSIYNTNPISDVIVDCISNGGKVLVFGVGGNAANAIHFTAELQGKFEKYEDPLPCIDLCSNIAVLTAITNDFGWEHVFERQIRALAQNGDIVLAFSIGTSGTYLKRAFEEALKSQATIILICGKYTPIPVGSTKDVMYLEESDNFIHFELDSGDTPKVQEVQLQLIHQICGEVKKRLSEN